VEVVVVVLFGLLGACFVSADFGPEGVVLVGADA
jgi:hypothetical protein